MIKKNQMIADYNKGVKDNRDIINVLIEEVFKLRDEVNLLKSNSAEARTFGRTFK